MIIIRLKLLIIILPIFFCYSTVLSQKPQITPKDQNPFISNVNEIKKSIAVIRVGTNNRFVKQGTAFLIDSVGVLATCSHILFDTTNYEGSNIIPDTSKISIKFNNSKHFINAEILISRKDRDITLIFPKIALNTWIRLRDSLQIRPVSIGESYEVQDGLDIACTGYDLGQSSNDFNELHYWTTTHKGIVSCTYAIGPTEAGIFLDRFQADMLINQGASGSPIYRSDNGTVIGMFRAFKSTIINGTPVNYGIAECVPIWAIDNLFINYIKEHQKNK
jgi:hypothetical protein